VPAKVAAIEYDPNRSARIALLHYTDGEKRYILWPVGVNVGDVLQSGEAVDIRPGNSLPLHAIPLGTVIHNIELKKGHGAQLIRSAGSFGQLMAKEGKYAQIRMPSTEVRKVLLECKATVASSATPSTRSSASARRAGTAGRVGGRRCAPGHESGRSPPRRRRGQERPGQPASSLALGPAHQGIQDARQQAHHQVHHQAARQRSSLMARSVKKGPFIDRHLIKKVEDMNRQSQKKVVKDVVAPLDHPSRPGGAHVRGAQRAQVHPGVRDREHGRPQAGRVRSHPHVPRPHRRQESQARRRHARGPGSSWSGGPAAPAAPAPK